MIKLLLFFLLFSTAHASFLSWTKDQCQKLLSHPYPESLDVRPYQDFTTQYRLWPSFGEYAAYWFKAKSRPMFREYTVMGHGRFRGEILGIYLLVPRKKLRIFTGHYAEVAHFEKDVPYGRLGNDGLVYVSPTIDISKEQICFIFMNQNGVQK